MSCYGASPDEALRKAGFLAPIDTLIGYYERCYLPTLSPRAPGTKRLYANLFDLHIAGSFGDTYLVDIDRAMLQRFFNGIDRKPRTIERIHSVMNQILSLAERDEIIPRNPAKHVRLPKPEKTRHKALQPWEVKALLETEYRNLVLLCGSGLRLGEALACGPWCLRDGVLSIEAQIVGDATGRPVRQEALKTPSSRRKIPFGFDMEGIAWTRGSCSRNSQGLKRAGGRLGIELTPHSLRHSFVTILEELECPRRVVAELVGHARSGVTDVYSQVSWESKEKWMDRYWETVMGSVELRIGRMA